MSRLSTFLRRLTSLPWRSITLESLDGTFLVAKTLCVFHVINSHLLSTALIYGPSMLPTLQVAGNIVAVDRATPRWSSVGLGDIVIVKSPENPRKTVAKRIVAVGGDEVTFLVDPALGTQSKTITVPEGHVWVQGDNIYDSRDSRHFGPVPYGLIDGRVFLKVWPPKDMGFIGQNV